MQDRIAIVKGICKRFETINVSLTVQFCKNGSYLHFARIKFSVGTFVKKPSLCCGCFTSKTILEENNKQTHMIIEHVRVIIQYHNPTTYH